MQSRISQMQWLVEVRGQRLGPFTTSQIVQRLMRKELKVIHRVSETGEGFTAICNEPIFEQYIIELIDSVSQNVSDGSVKKAMMNDDATVVNNDLGELSGLHNLNAIKLGITEQLSHAKMLQQASTNLSILRHILSEIRIKRKVIITPGENRGGDDEIHPDDKDQWILTPKNFKDYMSSGSSKFLFSLLILLIFVVVAMKFKEQMDEQALQEEIQAAKEAGLRDQYKGSLGEKGKIMDLSEENLIRLADQELGEQKTGVQWTLIESARHQGGFIQMGTPKPQNSQRQTEIFFALNKKAYEYLLGGELDKAEVFLLKSLAMYSEDKSPAILLLLETALLYDMADSSDLSKIRLQEIPNIIARYRKVRAKVSTKLLIAEMRAYQALGKSDLVDKKVEEFLKVHPRGEKEEPSIGYEQKTSWSGVLNHCVKVYQSNNTSPRYNAMLGGCLVRTLRSDKAEPYIYYAYKTQPSDPLIKDLLGWVYLDIGKIEKARKILWDPNVPSFEVSNYLTYSRIEFCKQNSSDNYCKGRGTASDK